MSVNTRTLLRLASGRKRSLSILEYRDTVPNAHPFQVRHATYLRSILPTRFYYIRLLLERLNQGCC